MGCLPSEAAPGRTTQEILQCTTTVLGGELRGTVGNGEDVLNCRIEATKIGGPICLTE